MPPADLIRLSTAAGLANCSVATLRGHVRRGELRHWRRGEKGWVYVSRAGVLALFKEGEVVRAAPARRAAGVDWKAHEKAMERLKEMGVC